MLSAFCAAQSDGQNLVFQLNKRSSYEECEEAVPNGVQIFLFDRCQHHHVRRHRPPPPGIRILLILIGAGGLGNATNDSNGSPFCTFFFQPLAASLARMPNFGSRTDARRARLLWTGLLLLQKMFKAVSILLSQASSHHF